MLLSCGSPLLASSVVGSIVLVVWPGEHNVVYVVLIIHCMKASAHSSDHYVGRLIPV